MNNNFKITGDKDYFGGEKPCSYDCCIFGFILQFMWNDPGSKYESAVKGQLYYV